jgi:hypothetical protein
LICTTTGCGNKPPVWATCFPPLDSTIAAPKAVAFGRAADSVLCKQDVATSTEIINKSIAGE